MSLIKTVKYAALNSSYYRDLFRKNGIDPSCIRTEQDFRKIPLTGKEDLSLKGKQFVVEQKPFSEWVTTSGTSTEPISVPLTLNDMKRLMKNEELSLSFAGITSKDRVLLAVAMDKLFVAGMAYYMGAGKIGATRLRCGASSSDFVIQSILRFKPTVLIGVPSFLIKVGRDAAQQNIFPAGKGIKKIVAIGEPVANLGYKRNNLGNTIETLYKAPVFSTYASTEMATSFCECVYQQGGHYLSELLYLEILDENCKPVKPGEKGEVVVTPLGVEGFPLLRYATGDIAKFEAGECRCGYKKGRLSPIIGRKSQMLKVKGTTVFLSGILDILASYKELKGYFITVLRDKELYDRITLKVSCEKNHLKKDFLISIKEKFKGALKFSPEIEIVSQSKIDELQTGAGSKKRFFEIKAA